MWLPYFCSGPLSICYETGRRRGGVGVIIVKSVSVRRVRPWLNRGLILILTGLALWFLWPR